MYLKCKRSSTLTINLKIKGSTKFVSSDLSSFRLLRFLDIIWWMATNFNVHYHKQQDWSVNLSSSFNHPRGYMLLKTNEEMGEAGLASQIEPS
jgi:hypothetical protein